MCAAPNVQPQIRQRSQLGSRLLAGHDPPSRTTPTTGLNPGRVRGSEQFSLDNDSAEDESQDRDDYFETVYTACLTLNASES